MIITKKRNQEYMKYLLLCSLLINSYAFSMFTHASPQAEEYFCKVMAISQPKLHKTKNTDIEKKEFLSFYQKYLPRYKKCISTILPMELCKHIDDLYAQLSTPAPKIRASATTSNVPTLAISNNGYYFAHNIANGITSNKTLLMNTHDTIAVLPSEKNKIIHSPNNEYCIIIDNPEAYKIDVSLYNIAQQKRTLLAQEAKECAITISNDSKYILIKQQHPTYPPSMYKLWTINLQGVPQEIPLKKQPGYKYDDVLDILYAAKSVIFLSDNEHIIYNDRQDQLQFCNLTTQTSKIITPHNNIYRYKYHSLENPVITTDNKQLLYKRCFLDPSEHDYALFNIETLSNIEPIIIQPQSCHKTELPIMAIPHKNMFTHISNKGCTLNLIDEKSHIVTSHNTENGSYITALAVDNTGNYLASGYSDGTIMIWNMSNNNPAQYTKIIKKNNGVITSLTFSDNQLLLSQAVSQTTTTDVLSYTTNSYTYRTYTYGAATLWDIYGNIIINCGNNIIKSAISRNGKTIIVISIKPHPYSSCNPELTVLQYTLNDNISLCTYKTNPQLLGAMH